MQQASPEGKGKGPATLCLSAVRLLRRMQEYGDLLRCCPAVASCLNKHMRDRFSRAACVFALVLPHGSSVRLTGLQVLCLWSARRLLTSALLRTSAAATCSVRQAQDPEHSVVVTALPECRVLKPAPYVLQGLFEVFETHMVHTYATFADVPLAALLGEAPMPEQVSPCWQQSSKLCSVQCAGLMCCRLHMSIGFDFAHSSHKPGNADHG